MKNTYTRREVIGYLRTIRRLFALCLSLAVAFVIMTVLYFTKPTVKNQDGTADNSTVTSATSSTPLKDKEAANLAKDLDNWNLLLVNKKNPLPEDFSITTDKIAAAYARDNGMLFDSRALEQLNAMCKKAAEDGVTLLVISCYRPHVRQEALFANELADVKAENPGMSEEEAKKLASTVVGLPGTTEHEVGRAVDLNSVEQSFEHTKQFTWLSSHAEEFGFVLRYPKDKEDITEIIYEPWHYRYVDV
jgi:D-alanyl-D-alanine carboxypeptidase